MRVIKYDTVQEFLDALTQTNSAWWEANNECHWIFRGQLAEDELKPTLYRSVDGTPENFLYQEIFHEIDSRARPGPEVSKISLKNRIKGYETSDDRKTDDVNRERLNEVIQSALVDVVLLEKFLLYCTEVGLYVPTIRVFEDLKHERDACTYLFQKLTDNEFIDKLYNIPYISYKDCLLPECLRDVQIEAQALARHHGIPSRLLDWTKNPIYAACFASMGKAGSDEKCDICVWALNTKEINFLIEKNDILIYRKLRHEGLEFLHNQKGLFTEMRNADGYYLAHGSWPQLNEYLDYLFQRENPDIIPNNYLQKLILPKSEVPELIDRLNAMGINKHSLMPTHDNVGESVKKFYTKRH